jgi:hypothetical protein
MFRSLKFIVVNYMIYLTIETNSRLWKTRKAILMLLEWKKNIFAQLSNF